MVSVCFRSGFRVVLEQFWSSFGVVSEWFLSGLQWFAVSCISKFILLKRFCEMMMAYGDGSLLFF